MSKIPACRQVELFEMFICIKNPPSHLRRDLGEVIKILISQSLILALLLFLQPLHSLRNHNNYQS